MTAWIILLPPPPLCTTPVAAYLSLPPPIHPWLHARATCLWSPSALCGLITDHSPRLSSGCGPSLRWRSTDAEAPFVDFLCTRCLQLSSNHELYTVPVDAVLLFGVRLRHADCGGNEYRETKTTRIGRGCLIDTSASQLGCKQKSRTIVGTVWSSKFEIRPQISGTMD